MADWTLPTVNDLWSNVIAYLKNRDLDLAKGMDPAKVTVTSPVLGMLRWNSANGYWESYNGTAWAAMAATYNINVSTLGGAAAALYAGLAGPTFTGTVTIPTPAAADNTAKAASTAFVQGEIASKAPLAAPALTGVPTAPTAAVDTTGTQLATVGFVLGQASALTPIMNGAAAVGIATRFARSDHVHPIDTSRAPLAAPAFTGVPEAPTATAGTNTTQLATTAFVTAAVAASQPFPSGTTTLFVQTAAPTGWTKSTAHNDKTLRVVSGAAGNGGSVAFSTAFASQAVLGSISVLGVANGYALTNADLPGAAILNNGGGLVGASGGSFGVGGGGMHGHTWTATSQSFTGTAINMAVQYVDVIIASKN